MEFINRGSRPTKIGFGEGIAEAGKRFSDLFVLGADITASVGLDLFAKTFPERFFSLGIAEQNCVGVAAGLALNGKIPVFATYGVFAALRAADQIRVSICYNNLHVIIGGAHAGISVGPDGATHQALEDLAVMRVLPNMTVLSPCDATQAKLLVLHAVEKLKGPVYIRFGREAVPDFTSENLQTEIGKGQVFKEGADVCIIATGHMVWEALQAAYRLEEKGVNARVINLHTVKPIDKKIIIDAARECKKIITVEEHQVSAGFGSAVSEVVSQECPAIMKLIGVHDRFGESGKPDELMKKFKLNAEDIYNLVLEFMAEKH
ncbi:MAG: transketolase C-terminal domain-containing protein [Bacteroidales bacterium]|jgi:transketolase|nr:transketolase family protein [Bacteroidales bacterium]